MLAEKIVIALLMMFLCTIIHALFMVVGTHSLERHLTRTGLARGHFRKAVLVSLMIMWMFFATVIEAWLWAMVYLYHPAITEFTDVQAAFYCPRPLVKTMHFSARL